ncbi:hypothetical protein JIN85_17265 [Luteolibacter pohnpeiensis]|uniref:Uncharacterized protein n=1 Tax=Luteolibacter pohnpeiensis TaxID=454153 RepID=A0A934SDK4_9BACT|nr:hypothetical protein [Luteolibacter pohnpeiensis]
MLAWILGCALLGGFAYVLIAMLATPGAKSSHKPLQVFHFSDGQKIEVWGVSTGRHVVQLIPENQLPFSLVDREESSRSLMLGMEVITDEKNKIPVRIKFKPNTSHAAMLIDLQLSGPSHTLLKSPYFWTEAYGGIVCDDPRFSSNSQTGEINRLNQKDETEEMLQSAMAKAGLGILLQHQDPDSGWINLYGPFLIQKKWPNRFISVLPAWRRDLKNLKFRVVLQHGEPLEFTLPNPDIHTAPAHFSPTPLPYSHDGNDFILTAKHLTKIERPGSHPFSAVDLKFAYTKTIHPGVENPEPFFPNSLVYATDEWGNSLQLTSVGPDSGLGAAFPASSKWFTLHFDYQRNEDFQQDRSRGLAIFEGTVSADGKEIQFSTLKDAKLFGITHPPTVQIGYYHDTVFIDGATKDWECFKMEYEGEFDQTSIQNYFANFQVAQTRIFIGDESRSSGLTLELGSNYSHFNDHYDFRRERMWAFPPGVLTPGTKVTIAIHPPLPDEPIEMNLPIPD